MASLYDAVERPRVIINTNDFEPKKLADAIERKPEVIQAEPAIPAPINDHHTSKIQSVINQLFGLNDTERYQLWPEKLVRDAISAPHDVMTGQIPTHEVDPVTGEVHTSSGLIKAAQDVSALAGTGGLAGAGNEAGIALGSGPIKQAMTNVNKPFYSAVENALTAAKQPKADAQQWLNFLKNQPGVKQEELAHLGLDKLQGSITKDDLLKAIQEGQPQINQVWKGTEQGPFGNAAYDAANSYRQDLVQKYGNGIRNKATPEELARLDDLEARGEMKNPSPTRHHKYQLPGGENYRELLLTLPPKQMSEAEARQVLNAKPDAKLTQADIDYASRKETQEYKSSHWDEPNVLAHIRMNDRNIDGKKSLHLEEIQSDWHQAGRKSGYKEELNEIKGVHGDNLKINEGEHDWQAVAPDGRTARVGKGVAKSEQDARDYLARYLNKTAAEKNSEARIAHADKVPDAPFKKTWDELSIKHALTEAIKNGYDQISWTPGEAQAARYDLSKQVDKIAVPMVNDNGTRSVRIDAKDGLPFKLTVNKEGIVEGHGSHSLQFNGKPLDDVVGKEMAEKIMKLEKPDEFSGDDLKVGGKGMKAFYDKMLVDKMNALTKKYGGKVEKGEVETHRGYPEKLSVYDKDGHHVKDFKTMAEARTYLADPANGVKGGSIKGNKAVAPKTDPVHVLKITPELREHVLKKGFPLFSAGVPVFSPIDYDPFKKDK